MIYAKGLYKRVNFKVHRLIYFINAFMHLLNNNIIIDMKELLYYPCPTLNMKAEYSEYVTPTPYSLILNLKTNYIKKLKLFIIIFHSVTFVTEIYPYMF